MKKLVLYLISGAAIGGVLTSIFAPGLIAWYFEPPVEIGVNCRPAVDWALSHLQGAQTIGLIVGAAVGAVIYFKFRSSGDPQRLNPSQKK